VLAVVILMAAALTSVLVAQVSFLFGELEKIVARVLSLSTESVTVLSVEVPVQRIIDQVGASLQDTLGSVATDPRDVVGLAFGVVETVLLTIFVFLMAFYLTRDADQIRAWLRGIVPPGYKRDSDILLAELDAVWTAFFRGQLTLAIIVAIIITIVASIIGLPQPLFWGLFAGLMEFLPSVGHAIYFIVAALVAMIEGSTTLPISNIGFVVVVAVVHLVFTQIDLNFLIPRIIGAQVHLHPMVVIIGIIVGASIGGVLGVALAAPVIASARVIGRYIYAQLFGLEPFPEVEPPARPAQEPAASPGEPLVPAQEEMA
jgi:predicted PurR-regulated permease PerM